MENKRLIEPIYKGDITDNCADYFVDTQNNFVLRNAIDNFGDDNLSDLRIFDKDNNPIARILIDYNNHFEKMFRIRLYYYAYYVNENTPSLEEQYFEENMLIQKLACEIKRSVGLIRFWDPISMYDIDWIRKDLSEEDTMHVLLRSTFRNFFSSIREDDKSVLNADNEYGYKLFSFLDKVINIIIYYYNNFLKDAKVDFNLFQQQISDKRKELTDGREKAYMFLDLIKNKEHYSNIDGIFESMLPLDVECYYNASLRLLEIDQKALNELKRSSSNDLKRILK